MPHVFITDITISDAIADIVAAANISHII